MSHGDLARNWTCPLGTWAPGTLELKKKRLLRFVNESQEPLSFQPGNPGQWQLVAGQLLAQSGEGLVGCQRARVGLGSSRLG